MPVNPFNQTKDHLAMVTGGLALSTVRKATGFSSIRVEGDIVPFCEFIQISASFRIDSCQGPLNRNVSLRSRCS